MPFATQSLLNDLKDWSASFSMKGGFTATVSLTNQIGQYGYSMLWAPFTVTLTSALVGATDAPGTLTCYTGNVTWVNGIINSVDMHDELVDRMITLHVRSYFARMSERPVNTHFFNTDAATAWAEVASTFGAIPSGLITTDLAASTIYGVVSGNNILDELHKVAQAGLGDMFVPRSGALTTQRWRTNLSSVDVVIPPHAVMSASLAVDDSVMPTRIVVRGRNISQYDAGYCVLTGDATEQYLPGGVGAGNTAQAGINRGTSRICTKSSTVNTERVANVGRLKGNRVDLMNASLSEQGGFSIQAVEVDPDTKQTKITMKNADGTPITTANNTFSLIAVGRMQDDVEKTSPAAKQKPLKGNVSAANKKSAKMAHAMQRSHGLKHGGSHDNDRHHDEQEPSRIEMIVDDTALQSVYGVVYEQIDNVYASDYETLFNIAVRRFQEARMQKRAWHITLKYVACLDIGQVVTFTHPKTGDTVTGLLTDLSVKYSPDPKADMEATVLSFETIGATTYYSGNLLMYPNMNGYNNINWVVTSGGLGNFVRMFHGYAGLRSVGAGVILSQTIVAEVGAVYTFVCDVAIESGTIAISVGTSTGTYSTNGTITLTYTSTSTSLTVSFQVTGTSVAYVAHPFLSKSSAH